MTTPTNLSAAPKTATRTQSDMFDVVISGASFAGLAVARGLSQAMRGDIRIGVMDRVAAPSLNADDGRAFAIWAGAHNVLQGLGVWPAIAPDAQPITSVELTDSNTSDAVRMTRMTYPSSTDRVGHDQPSAFMVPATTLLKALHDAVVDDPAIQLLAPASAASVAVSRNAIETTLQDGARLRSALCVAADGRNSMLREAAGIKTVAFDYDQIGVVATVAFTKPHHGVAIQHFLPGGPFAVLPLKGQRACITWSAPRRDAERLLALDDVAFLAELETRIGGRFGAISLAGPRRSWPLSLVMPRALTAPRFCLIGDAAHGVHPIAGQGVNLALRDAAALIEVVSDALRLGLDAGHSEALERYQRWRRFDSVASAATFDALNRLFSVDSAVLRAGRGAGLGLIDRWPDVKRWIFEEAAGVTGEVPRLVRGVPV